MSQNENNINNIEITQNDLTKKRDNESNDDMNINNVNNRDEINQDDCYNAIWKSDIKMSWYLYERDL